MKGSIAVLSIPATRRTRSDPMPSPARVLILNERDPRHPKAGGAEIHLSEIFQRLVTRGFEVTLAAASFSGSPARDEVDGMRVWRLGRLPAYYPLAAKRGADYTLRRRHLWVDGAGPPARGAGRDPGVRELSGQGSRGSRGAQSRDRGAHRRPREAQAVLPGGQGAHVG